jgi:hypothetical protein
MFNNTYSPVGSPIKKNIANSSPVHSPLKQPRNDIGNSYGSSTYKPSSLTASALGQPVEIIQGKFLTETQ